MTTAFLIYPHQLFEGLLTQQVIKTFILVEEPLFFTQFAFHKKKLMFHRASMKFFENELKDKGFKVIYVDSEDIPDTKDIAPVLKKHKIDHVFVMDLVDDWLEKRLNKALKDAEVTVSLHKNPGFFLGRKEVTKEFSDQTNYKMASFYIKQRKRFNILLEDGKPWGGKWSFDIENRKKLPKTQKIPDVPKANDNPYIQEAKKYVEKHFPDNYGSSADFFYPVTHGEAKKWLNTFLQHRFALFGTYQDAISQTDSLLFHSILSPLINAGLILPDEVVHKAIHYAEQHNIPISSLEGFIRQIIGWREFVRGVYRSVGGKERTTNFWGHKRKLPESFWKGTTGIEPIDRVIKKVLETGYAHHIERLMVVANFMLLCEIDPDDMYRWFMELFIDAYDWVMVPNVYGMGSYADGGMITTKPYISSANYILKMSDFKKGEWVEIWNSLYWNFVEKHRKVFEQNPRSLPIVNMLDRQDEKVRENHRRRAKQFLESLE